LMIHQGQLIYDGSLEGLVDRFSPCREISIEFAQTYSKDQLMLYGDLQESDKHSARFLVPQEALTRTVGKLLGDLEILDLTVIDPPIEEVIGRVFQAGTV